MSNKVREHWQKDWMHTQKWKSLTKIENMEKWVNAVIECKKTDKMWEPKYKCESSDKM